MEKHGMRGAISAGTEDKVARVIGVLANKTNWQVKEVRDKSSTQVYLSTPLHSYELNIINGTLPDGLIALRGGPGILFEVAFASYVGKPVWR